jgi:predicted flap endonuclease-1-like 5' DNA nuclease
MGGGYYLDPDCYSLDQFEQNLSSRDMIPSRVLLKENLEERFEVLRKSGLKSLGDLLRALKTKTKIASFADKSGIPADYLVLLNREARSYQPKPVRLGRFSGIPDSAVQALEEQGVKHSRHFFEQAQHPESREELARMTGISMDLITELLCLSDLVRLYGFGPVFARMFYDVGIRTVKEVQEYTPEEIVKIYQQTTGRKADFSAGDIQFSLELARTLDLVLNFDA